MDEKGARKVAQAYLDHLYSEEEQDIIGRNFYRPTSDKASAGGTAMPSPSWNWSPSIRPSVAGPGPPPITSTKAPSSDQIYSEVTLRVDRKGRADALTG